MAVRFNPAVSNATLSRSAANITSGAASSVSGCLWVKRKVDTGAFSTAFYINTTGGVSGTDLELFIETETGGDRLDLYEVPGTESSISGVTLTVDTWFFIAWSRSNTSRKLWWGTESGGTLSSGTNADSRTVTDDVDVLHIGNDIYTEPINGEIAYVRFWESTLSDAEADAEWRSTTPVKASVRGDWRLATAASAGTDSSGNSLTLTVSGTLTDATNPTPPAAAGGAVIKDIIAMGLLVPR